MSSPLMPTSRSPSARKSHRADVDAFNTLRLFFAILARQRTLEACAAQMKGL